MDGAAPSLAIAFSAGFLSFVSPCVLPLVPAYVSYVTGLSLEELTRGEERLRVKWRTFQNALLFIAGFSTVFILFGASATVIGQLLLTYQRLLRWVGGGLIIFRKDALHGATTAAGLWIAAGIGIAVGFGLYSVAIFTAILSLIMFTGMWYVENRFKHWFTEHAPDSHRESTS
mgnify:CR=1 FL=1